MAKKKKE
jgi:hypothetical protein